MITTAAILILPAVLALFALLTRRTCTPLLLIGAFVHNALTLATWLTPLQPPQELGTLGLDELGRLFLTIVSILFTVSSFYASGYIPHEPHSHKSERAFVASLLFFLSTMTLVTYCQHFEMLWVAIEATTLASAPLIYFHRTKHSLEATWKYLIICSFGIALALLGNFCISVAATHGGDGGHTSLLIQSLSHAGGTLQPQWLKAAFIFLFVGYATKMGLAPLHSWLPDAHSEAPSFVSALLSGALLNCAFLGILRGYQVAKAAGLAGFAEPLFVIFGLLSMAFAAVFILHQADFKRMLAYSSVEHMGVLLLSVGLGGGAVFGGMLHLLGHSLIKAMLFLLAGNILLAYKTKSIHSVTAVRRALPASGGLWFLGLFAITGAPPFGLFTSELIILKAAIDQGRPVVAFIFLLLLAVIFIGIFQIGLRMLLGTPKEGLPAIGTARELGGREPLWSILPPAFLAVLIFILGPNVPPFLAAHLQRIAELLRTGGVG